MGLIYYPTSKSHTSISNLHIILTSNFHPNSFEKSIYNNGYNPTSSLLGDPSPILTSNGPQILNCCCWHLKNDLKSFTTVLFYFFLHIVCSMTSKFVMVSSWGACYGSNMDTIPILVLGFFWVGGCWVGIFLTNGCFISFKK